MKARKIGVLGAVLCAGGLLLATGCESGAAYQIDAQQARINDLEREKGQLEADLRAMQQAADAARNRALELEKALADARRQLAEQPETVQAPPNWQGSGPIMWTDIAEDILFDSGKADLKPSGRQRLHQVVEEIRANFPDRLIWVVGHTDTDPIRHTAHLWKDNLDLSLERGRVVAKELMSLGITAKDVIAGGQGEVNPVAPNDSKENKARNRRVQIIAVARPAQSEPAGEGVASSSGG